MHGKNYIWSKQSFGIIMGVLTAIIILSSQTFYYDYLADAKASAPVAQEADGEAPEEVVAITQEAISVAVQVVVGHVLHFISDIFTVNTETVTSTTESQSDFNSFFRTLFRLIISPNAP